MCADDLLLYIQLANLTSYILDLFNFYSERLETDWINFDIEGWHDPYSIASNLSKYFTPYIVLDSEPIFFYSNLREKAKVSIRHYTGFKGYGFGT